MGTSALQGPRASPVSPDLKSTSAGSHGPRTILQNSKSPVPIITSWWCTVLHAKSVCLRRKLSAPTLNSRVCLRRKGTMKIQNFCVFNFSYRKC